MTEVRDIAAFVAFGLTIGVALTRPRISRYTIGPAIGAAVGVGLALALGSVTIGDIREGVSELNRALITVAALMVTTAAAVRLGVIHQLAGVVIARAGRSPQRLFTMVFFLSALCAAVLNNDGAVLLLTPLIITAVRGVYPGRPWLLAPFVFAVFTAAGVAPFVVSNPMNMIVADYADIGFNYYAARMIPIAVPGWLLTLAILRRLFRSQLERPGPVDESASVPLPWTTGQRAMVALLLSVLAAYPVVSYLGGPIWAVATTGAAVSVLLVWRENVGRPVELLARGVPWEILAFLFGVFVLALALRNAGVVDWLAHRYEHAPVGAIGFASAAGSAMIGNHPMAIMNLFAIEQTPTLGSIDILAALIGGDLGPRLLPIGSLAGLLWFDSLRRQDVHVPLRQFIAVGAAVTIPGLVLSLALLSLLHF